jgi:metal-responsive CopG/Arc/MetJ family transcriptional regulator
VEEVNEHMRNMDYIILLFDSVSNNNEIRQQARDKIVTLEEKGKQVMLASVQGQVRKRDLMEVLVQAEDIGQESSSPRKRIRAQKNQLAKEVEVVLGGLQERSEAFRKAIEERETRDKEKAEREKEIYETQKDINAKLDALLGTMNMFLQLPDMIKAKNKHMIYPSSLSYPSS